MSFLGPAFLVAGAAAALVVAVFHLIVTREPAVSRLPTARFAPDRDIEARAPAIQPRDLALLLLRAGAVLAAGAALAGPIVRPARRDLLRIVMLDRSNAVAHTGESSDSARALLGSGDILILFDSASRIAGPESLDSLPAHSVARDLGNISAALVTALRAGSRFRDRADSLELVLISPLLAGEFDAATDSIRSRWPGRIRLVRVDGDSAAPAPLALLGAADDPIRMALPSILGDPGTAGVRMVRGAMLAEDSAWARIPDHTLVIWPAGQRAPPGWRPRSRPDTVSALLAGGEAVVTTLVRRFEPEPAALVGGRIPARWVDGAPASIEHQAEAGCIRTVAFEVPVVGDLVLTARFARLAARLTAPCGRLVDSRRADSSAVARLEGAGGAVPRSALPEPARRRSPWEPGLLVLALGFLGAETMLRRRHDR